MNTKENKLKHNHSSYDTWSNDIYKDINKGEPKEMFKKTIRTSHELSV
jgi:hypothetical protein